MALLKDEISVVRVTVAGALSWVLPGLGHLYLGQRTRGLIIIVTMTLIFWGGVAIGGVQSTVKPIERKAWFMAQICTGSHAMACYAWGRLRDETYPDERAGFTEEDTAVIYTGVAGLLNILIILDALASADPNYVRAGTRVPPRPHAEEIA